MIYLIIFIYLFYLSIKYDVLGGKQYKMTHFYVVLILLILISGFRYRLGTDTYGYMNEFHEYHNLFLLKIEDFSIWRYQPLWILLNSLAKTIGGFVLVQFFISILHIWLLGLVLKKLSPSLLFSSLLLYYMFDYTTFNMEVMREAVSVSYFLMALLALDKGRIMYMFIYIAIAFLFHAYSLLVFLLFLFYFKILVRKPILSIISIMCIIVVCIIEKNFIIELIARYVVGSDTIYTDSAITYAQSDKYGETDLSWKGILITFTLPILYLGMLFITRKHYHRYINMNPLIFNTTIYLASTLILLRYSLAIIDRIYNYFHVFTFLLIVLFFNYTYTKIKNKKQRIGIFISLILIPIFCAYKQYYRTDGLVDTEKNYSRYYPYSSIFNKTKDPQREKIFYYK